MPNPIDLDEALFQRIEYYIVHEKMFLQPRLSREDVTNLLKEHQEYSVEAVARECGIPAPQTFYRIFVKKYGMTPTEYRKK